MMMIPLHCNTFFLWKIISSRCNPIIRCVLNLLLEYQSPQAHSPLMAQSTMAFKWLLPNKCIPIYIRVLCGNSLNFQWIISSGFKNISVYIYKYYIIYFLFFFKFHQFFEKKVRIREPQVPVISKTLKNLLKEPADFPFKNWWFSFLWVIWIFFNLLENHGYIYIPIPGLWFCWAPHFMNPKNHPDNRRCLFLFFNNRPTRVFIYLFFTPGN